MGIFKQHTVCFAPNEDGSGGGDSGGGDKGGGSGDTGGQGGDPPGDKGKGGEGGKPPPKQQQNDGDLPGEDDPMWSDAAKTKAYVKDLRKENAKHRTENKDLKTKFGALNERFGNLEGGLKKALGLEENASPEEQIGSLHETVDSLNFDNAIKDIAIEHGIKGGKALTYLKFLISEGAGSLEENDELSEEAIMGFVDQTQKAFGGDSSDSSTTIIEDGKGGKKPPPSHGNELTVEQFAKMTTVEKGELFGKQPDIYKSLMAQAREKRLI